MQSAWSTEGFRYAVPFRRMAAQAAVFFTTALALSGAAFPAHAEGSLPTETTLAVSPASPAEPSGGRTTFEIHVSSPAGEKPARGVVTLTTLDADGGEHSIGSAPLRRDGSATVVTGDLPGGDTDVHASYSGDAVHAPSISAHTSVHAEATGVPTFTLTAAPTALNLVAGTFGNSILTLTPANGFTGYVTVSCSGLPLGASCIFTPTNIFVDTTGGRATVTIQTTGPSGKASIDRAAEGLVYAVLFPGILGLAGLGLRRRGPFGTLALVLLVSGLAAGLSSCAARYRYFNNPPVQTIGTPAGTSSVTVEATSVNGSQVTTQTLPIALTVTAK